MKKSESNKNTGTPGEETAATPVSTMPRVTSAKRRNPGTAAQTVPGPEPEIPPAGSKQAGSTVETVFSLPDEIGIQIVATHTAAKGAFAEVLVSAAKCGLLLLAAKEVVKPGFEAWFEQMKFPFTKVTRCKYMRLADRVCEEAKSKPGLLLSVQPGADGLPASFTFDELRLRTVITAVSEGRSLNQLYIDWSITKGPSGEGPTAPRSPEGDSQEASPESIMRHWCAVVEHAPLVFPRLSLEQQSELVSQLEALIKTLQAARQTVIN